MDGEMNAWGHSSETDTSLETINILVVDDDTTCLSIVAAILKKWKYEVVTVKHPIDALCTLRIKGGSFDLVVVDVHMPDMNGFELKQLIDEEFNLPVVLMSADDKEGVILKGLESGAVYFIVKPISPDDLKDLWQYVTSKKKGRGILKETASVQGNFSSDKHRDEDAESVSSANEDWQSKKESKRKSMRKDNDDKEEGDVDSATPKKAKVVWTNALHNRFLEAIRSLGLERAVPKKILELMKVPGLTRENVASHLQKYRIFLKRVSDASYRIQSASEKSSIDRSTQSSLVCRNHSLMHKNLRQECWEFPGQQQNRSFFKPRLGGHVLVDDALNFGSSVFPNQEASTSNFIPQSGGGQSLLLSNQVNLRKSIIGGANTFYQGSRSSFGTEPNNYQTGLSLHGGISSGLINNLNSMQINQTLKGSLNNGSSDNNSTTFGVRGLNSIQGNSNCVGNQMLNDERLTAPSNMRYMGTEASNDLIGTNGLINGIQNGNMITAQMLTSNFGHLAQGVSSSAWKPGIEGAKQSSPTFTNGIQGVSTLVPLPTLSQQVSLGNGGQGDFPFGSVNNTSTFMNISCQLPYFQGDLSDSFLNQVNIGCPNQQHGDEEVLMSSNFCSSGNKLDGYFPWLDQNPNQEQSRRDFVNSNYSTYQSNNTLAGTHESPIERDDEEFLESVFGSDPYGGENSLEDF